MSQCLKDCVFYRKAHKELRKVRKVFKAKLCELCVLYKTSLEKNLALFAVKYAQSKSNLKQKKT